MSNGGLIYKGFCIDRGRGFEDDSSPVHLPPRFSGRPLRAFPALVLTFVLLGIGAGGVHALSLRSFPVDAKRATATFSAAGGVRLGDDAVMLSPGAQIRDASNRIVQPSHIRGEYPVRVKFDHNGQVHRVWLLTPAEAAAPEPTP